MTKCPFCHFLKRDESFFYKNDFWIYGLVKSHPLQGSGFFIPRAHITSFDDLTIEDLILFQKALRDVKTMLMEKFSPQGFSLCLESGKVAGELCHHLCFSLLSRYKAEPFSGLGLDHWHKGPDNKIESSTDTDLLGELEAFLNT